MTAFFEKLCGPGLLDNLRLCTRRLTSLQLRWTLAWPAHDGQPTRFAGRLAAAKYAAACDVDAWRGCALADSSHLFRVRAVLIAIAPVPPPTGQKAVISRTAVFLCVFVVVHAIGNLTAICGQSAFNDCAFVPLTRILH